MKYLILTLMLISMTAMADDMPSYLKDGKIAVTLKDGKTYYFEANDFKVVPRVQAKLAEPEKKADAPAVVQAAPAAEEKKNRVMLYGGYGPTGGLNTTNNGANTTVTSEKGAVGGVGYQRNIKGPISVGGAVLNNGTYLGGVGIDF